MADARKLAFAPFGMPAKGVLLLFCEEGLKLGPAARKALALKAKSDRETSVEITRRIARTNRL